MANIKYTITADQITDVIPAYYLAKRTPLFVGAPGTAKTAFVREAAKYIALNIVKAPVVVREVHLASMAETDIRGYLIPNGDNAVFTKPEFWSAVEQNPYGILFFDEFMQAPPEVQKAVAPLIYEGRIGEFYLPPGWMVVCAGNGLDDGAGTNSLLSHIVNRVGIINTKAPDVDVWATWAAASDLDPVCIAFAKLRPDAVFDAALPDAPDTPYCTVRSLHAVSDVAKGFPGGLPAMVESSLGMAMLNGQIGSGAASELSGLVRVAMNLPSYDDIVANPQGTLVPTEPDKAYAMIMLAAVRCKTEHQLQVCTYMSRFAPNFAVTGFVAMVRRNPDLAANPAFSQWVQANVSLLTRFTKYISTGV